VTYVGRPLRRAEDVRFLTGRARYLPDLEAEGVVQAAFARSPYPHARVVAVDTGAASSVPGVAGGAWLSLRRCRVRRTEGGCCS